MGRGRAGATAAGAIRDIVSTAGFTQVLVTAETLTFTVPSAAAFVDWVAAGAPTTRRNLAQLPEARRADFTRLVADRLEPYRTKHALSVPSSRNIVAATG